MERFSPFINLTSEELAVDESFQSYVFRRNKEDIRFWETFIALYSERQNQIDGAVEILTVMAFRKKHTLRQLRELELNRLLSSISALESSDRSMGLGRKPEPGGNGLALIMQAFFCSHWSRLAASATGLLILLSAGFFLMTEYVEQGTVIYETRYGENMTVQLPDSSVVTLNGNTRLTLHENWDSRHVREVWLDGEAFFEVRKKTDPGAARFTVHTSGMDIEVLGTRFNVFNRDDRANVVLNSGKVELKIASPTDTSTVLMKPDEAVEFRRKDRTIIKKQVNAELLTSWRNKVLVFENTPLHKIGEMIEYTYGMEVIFDENVDRDEALAGTIPSENLDILLTVLAKSSNLTITRNNNKITIQRTDPVSTPH